MDIVRRAYELWEQAGRPEGKDQEFYHQAEQQLTGAAGQRDEPAQEAPGDAAPHDR